jgi:hypothetical protein
MTKLFRDPIIYRACRWNRAHVFEDAIRPAPFSSSLTVTRARR